MCCVISQEKNRNIRMHGKKKHNKDFGNGAKGVTKIQVNKGELGNLRTDVKRRCMTNILNGILGIK